MNTETGTLFEGTARTWEIDEATAAAGAPAEALDVFTKASILQLQFRRLGVTRKITSDAIDVKGQTLEERTDKELVRAQKKILVSPELLTIERHDNATQAWIEGRKAGPAFANVGGFHLIPNALQAEVDAYLDDRLKERGELVERFLDQLEYRVAQTKRRLGVLAKDTRFPTVDQAAASFRVARNWFTLGYRDEGAAKQWQADALAECREALRAGFAEVVSHLAERLQPGPDGKLKVFRNTLVENFAAFVETFEARNLANDTELARLVSKARDIMTGVDADTLRKQGALRSAIGRAVSVIDEAAATLVTNAPTRFYGE